MRALISCGWVLPMAVALTLALAGCGAQTSNGINQRAAVLGERFDLPAPGALRAVSTVLITLDGKEYEAAWPQNRVMAYGTHARYTPQYAGVNRHLTDAAYAIYALDVSTFSGVADLYCNFTSVGNSGDAWVGLADYNHNRWDWQKLPDPVAMQSMLPFDITDRSSGGVLPVALVFIGTKMWELTSLSLGDEPELATWPMAGQNVDHTGRSPNLGAKSANVLWKYHTQGPGTKIESLWTAPDNTLYVSAGDGLFAFDPQGELLWDCYGVTPKSPPVIGPDGNLYIGGSWPNAGLHVLDSVGKRKWSYWTDFDVVYSPAVLPNGTICFVTADNMLRCIYANGNPKWEYSFPTISSSPVVAADGTIYVGTQSADFNPISYLDAVNSDGTLDWEITLGCRNKPVIAPDGSIVCVYGKNGELAAVNPDGTQKWSASGATASGWPAIDANGVVYIAGSSIKALSGTDGSTIWSLALTGAAYGDVGLSPDGKTLAVSTETGQIFMCDTDGTALTNIETGSEFWVGAAAGDGVGYFADKDYYITACNRDSSIRWRDGVGGRVISSPVTATDGTVYFGSEDRSLYAMTPDGQCKWRYLTGGAITASPMVLPDGTIVVGSKDHKLHAVNPDGTALWQYETEGMVEGNPALGPDGKIYFGSDDWCLYALNQDGTLAWSYKTAWNVTGGPTVDTDGKVYFSSWDNYVYCLNPDGTLDWSFLTQGPVKGSVALSGDLLYVACAKDSYRGRISALTKSGTQVWWYNTGGQATMSPTVGEDGTVYVTTILGQSNHERAIYAVRNQTMAWHYDGASLASGMALDVNGVLFAGMGDGRMLAMDTSTGVMQLAWTCSDGPANFFAPAITNGRTYVGYDTGIYAFGDN
jgi:outer membrane protein assembly factor BamB